MHTYRDPCRQSTIIELFDKDFALHRDQIYRLATNEVINVLVKQGLRDLQRPRTVAVRRSTCFIPHKKRT